MILRLTGCALAAALAVAASSAGAATVFDFESATATYTNDVGLRPGDLSVYTETVDGLTLTITRPGSVFDIVENDGFQGGKPAGFGVNSLDPFFTEFGGAFVASFSAGLTSISIDFGDYGSDSPDELVLQMYSEVDGGGVLLGTTSGFFASAFPAFGTVSFASATPFRSVVFIGGTAGFPNSVFYDNIAVEAVAGPVPEPGAWALMILGFGLVGGGLRRRARALSPA